VFEQRRVHGVGTVLGSLQNTVAQLNSMASVSAARENETVRALSEEQESSEVEASASAGQAITEAQRVARLLQQRQQQQKMALELSAFKQTASNANAKLAEVSNDVAATKSQLDKTTRDMKSITGDMG
jgi:hypothetical protein